MFKYIAVNRNSTVTTEKNDILNFWAAIFYRLVGYFNFYTELETCGKWQITFNVLKKIWA